MSINGADDGGSTTPVDLKAPILEVCFQQAIRKFL